MDLTGEAVPSEFVVRIAGHVAEYAPEGRAEFRLPVDGRPISQVLREMGMKRELIRVLLVGGKRVAPDYVPVEGDVVTLVAPAAGG